MHRINAPLNELLGGLRPWPDDARAAARDAALAIIGVTLVIVVADGLVFRPYLPDWYVARFGGPKLFTRILFFMLKCISEEVFYRGFLMTALAR